MTADGIERAMEHAAIPRLRRPSADESAGAVISAFFLVVYIAAALAVFAVGLSSGPLGPRTATVIDAALLAVAAVASGALNARRVGL
jgi:hypothetical protein